MENVHTRNAEELSESQKDLLIKLSVEPLVENLPYRDADSANRLFDLHHLVAVGFVELGIERHHKAMWFKLTSVGLEMYLQLDYTPKATGKFPKFFSKTKHISLIKPQASYADKVKKTTTTKIKLTDLNHLIQNMKTK